MTVNVCKSNGLSNKRQMCYNINTDLHAQQSCPAGKGTNESSATNHQKSAFEQCERREIATEITAVQMVVQDKFHPQVITSSWCSKRPPEHYERLFQTGRAISSLPLWRQQYSPNMRHSTRCIRNPAPGLLKTTAQCKFQGQWDSDEASPLHWNLNVAILSFEEKKNTLTFALCRGLTASFQSGDMAK